PKRFETEKRKDGGERFALLVSKVFKLHRFYLLARKEFEQTLELLPVKSSVDVSKAARFSRRRARNAILFVSHGIEKIERLATSKPLHVPVSKGAVDRISQQNQQFSLRIVFPNPFRRWLVIHVTWRAITSDARGSKERIMFV